MHEQQATIRAMMTPKIEKFDEAGVLVETLELPAREVFLTPHEAQSLGLTPPPAAPEAPGTTEGG